MRTETATNRDTQVVVAFDLDGVLVDNVAFEHAVTDYIVRQLSLSRHISIEAGKEEWNRVLTAHRSHPRWHDYLLHCEHLGLGNVWKDAHLKCSHLLRKYDRIDEVISVARERCECWVITDATEWVANFKLKCIGHSSSFSEIFSSTRCGYSKSFDSFWQCIAHKLPRDPIWFVFIENRLDIIHRAARFIRQCVPVWLDTPDHPHEIGFHHGEAGGYRRKGTRVFAHNELPEKLEEIISDCYSSA